VSVNNTANRLHGVTTPDAIAWIAEIFEEPVTRVSESTMRADLPAWDSLGQLVLMAGLDERFGVRVTPSELATVKAVGDILDILRRNGVLRAE
jgi:acyl carrier protein